MGMYFIIPLDLFGGSHKETVSWKAPIRHTKLVPMPTLKLTNGKEMG